MFGHLALWQTVCSFCSLTRFSSLAYPAPLGIFIFSHAGLRPMDGDGAGDGAEAPAERMLRETDAFMRASIKCREPRQGEQITQLCGRRGRGGSVAADGGGGVGTGGISAAGAPTTSAAWARR